MSRQTEWPAVRSRSVAGLDGEQRNLVANGARSGGLGLVRSGVDQEGGWCAFAADLGFGGEGGVSHGAAETQRSRVRMRGGGTRSWRGQCRYGNGEPGGLKHSGTENTEGKAGTGVGWEIFLA